MYRIIDCDTGEIVIEDRILMNIAPIMDALHSTYPGAYRLECD